MQATIVGNHGRPLVLLVRGWMSSPTDKRVVGRIRRCNEYLATHVGPPIETAEQRANDDVFRRVCTTGSVIFDYGAGAGALVRSYLAHDGSDLARLQDVPAAVLELAWLDELRSDGPSLASVLKSGQLVVLDASIGRLRVKWRDYVFGLTPTGRADVDGDGFEDLIVMVQSRPLKGGAVGLRFAFVTKKNKDGPMRVVRPVLQ